MTETNILSGLKAKRTEIERQIASMASRIADARADLLHVSAVIRIFDPKASDDKPAPGYLNTTKAMPRSKVFEACRDALRASAEPLDTRELARHIIRIEGWDIEDRRLRLAIAHRVGATLARLALRGHVIKIGERDKASLWRLT